MKSDLNVSSEIFESILQANQDLIRTDIISLAVFLSESQDYTTFNSSSIQLEKSDLNELFLNTFKERTIAVIRFSRNDNSIGYATYYLKDDRLYIKTDFNEKIENYQVNSVILQDILYLQKKNCLNCDFTMIKAKTDNIDFNRLSKNGFNDLALERFMETKFEKTANGNYQLKRNETLSYQRSDGLLSDYQKNVIDDYCGYTHWCTRGGGIHCDTFRAICVTLDAWDCAYVAMDQFVATHQVLQNTNGANSLDNFDTVDQGEPSNSNFSSLLPPGNLYAVKEQLELSYAGGTYVDTYYQMSSHFRGSLDLSLASSIISITGDLYELANRYLLGGDNAILLDESLFNKIQNIANKSKLNSSSSAYANALDIMIMELGKYKNKTVGQAVIFLQSPY